MLTEEELAAFRNHRRERRPGLQEKIVDPALRYYGRGARVAGLGLGTAISQLPTSRLARTIADKTPLPDDMWFLPGDAGKTMDAWRVFNEQRKLGDWDAGIAAAQDEFDAGAGFWGASELGAEVLVPGGLAKAGTGLIKGASRFGDFAPAVEAVGKGLRLPWEAEEAVGRAAFAPIAAGARGIRNLLRRGPAEEYLTDVDVSQPQLALGPGARPMPPGARPMPPAAEPIEEFLAEGVVPPTATTPPTTRGDAIIQDVADEPILGGRTRYEQGIDEGGVPEGVLGTYVAEPQSRAGGFFDGIREVRRTHPYGAAVEVKDPAFYSDPTTRLYLTPDDSAGVAVTPDGDLVSVYRKTDSIYDINPLLNEASKVSRTLDGYDIGGKLPNLYADHGFRPAARVRFNPEYAPEGWNYELMGEPDIVVMVRDVDGLTGLPEIPVTRVRADGARAGGYKDVMDDVPIFDDFDDALKLRDAAVAKLPSPAPTTAAPTPGAAVVSVTPDVSVRVSNDVIQAYGRDIVRVELPGGRAQPFYLRTGGGGGGDAPSGGAGHWVPFDGINELGWFVKTPYVSGKGQLSYGKPLYRYGTQELKDIGLALDAHLGNVPKGRIVREGIEGIAETNEFLAKQLDEATPAPAAAVPTPGAGLADDVPLSPSAMEGADQAAGVGARAAAAEVPGAPPIPGAPPPSGPITMAGRAVPPGGGVPPGGVPPGGGRRPPPPRDSAAGGPYLDNNGPVKQLQDIGQAIRRATTGGLGRQLANNPLLRPLFRRIAPSAVDTDTKGKALFGRSILMEEGRQKADQAFTHLSRGGTQTQVFGETDGGLLLEGPLRGLFINDIRSNPARYRDLLTIEQQKWIKAADDLERSKLSFLKINGIDVPQLDFSSGGQYAGRRLLGKLNPETGQIEGIGVYRPKAKKLKQETDSEHHRYFDTVEEAMAEGYRYIPEDEALLFNLRDAYRRVTEKRFSEWAVDNIDELHLGPGGKDISAGAKLGTYTPDLEGAYFTGPDAERLAREFDDALTAMVALEKTPIANAVTKANAIGRFMTLNGDAGQFLIQLLFLANFRPKIWGQSIGAFARTLVSTRYHSNLINNNRDLLARHPNLITSLNGTEMTEALQKGGYLTTSLGAPGRFIARTLDPFGRAFGAAMDDAGINLAKALESRALLPGKGPYNPRRAYTQADFDPAKMADIDDFINEMRGIANSARIGVTNKQQMLESMMLLAPRYNRAIAALLYDAGRGTVEMAPGVTSTVRGDLGREALVRSLAGLTSLAVAISLGSYAMKQTEDGKPLNMEDALSEALTHVNPASPRFFTWEMNGVNIGPGTKVRSLISFAARSTDDQSSFQDVATNFARGQGAPVIGAAWDALTGFGYMGEPTPIGVGAFGQNEYWEDYTDKPFPTKAWEAAENQILPHFVPIWIQGMLMSNGTASASVLDRVKMGAGEFVGLRTSQINRTQIAVEYAREQGLVTNREGYENLPGVEKQRIDDAITREIGPRDYRGKEGKLYEQKDKARAEHIELLQADAISKDKGAIASDIGGQFFSPLTARRSFIDRRNKYNQAMVGINEQLYGEDVEEEPEANTYAHDIWSYYQIYEGLDDIQDDELKYEIIAEREGTFWSDISKDAVFDTGAITGNARVGRILDSVRLVEDNYPPSVKRMVDAMRYASIMKQEVMGETLSYWDLDEHASFVTEMQELTGANPAEIKAFFDLPFTVQRGASLATGSMNEKLFTAATYSKRKGVMNSLKSHFINGADPRWLLAMVYSGYTFPKSGEFTKQLKNQIADGATIPESMVDFRALYQTELVTSSN